MKIILVTIILFINFINAKDLYSVSLAPNLLEFKEMLNEMDNPRHPNADFYDCSAEACEKAYFECTIEYKLSCRKTNPGIDYKSTQCYIDGVKSCKEQRGFCEKRNAFGQKCH